MAVKGGRAEGFRMSYTSWGEHITGGKVLVLNGVDAILQTPEWRKRFDEVWYGLIGKPDGFDVEAAQAERRAIVAKRLDLPLKIVVAQNVLTTNLTNGDWQAHKSMLERAAELADAGSLRVARPAVDMSISGMYQFSIYDVDEKLEREMGASRGLFLEGADGPAIYPANDNASNLEMLKNCETGFDRAWLLSGIDFASGPEAHLDRKPHELEIPNESLVAVKTTRYIGELAAAGGWN